MATRKQHQGGRTDRDSFTRAAALTARLFAGEELTARKIMSDYGVCGSTAHRDLVELECFLPVTVEEVHRRGWVNPQKKMRLAKRCAGSSAEPSTADL